MTNTCTDGRRRLRCHDDWLLITKVDDGPECCFTLVAKVYEQSVAKLNNLKIVRRWWFVHNLTIPHY